jgi:hypothetical protein
MVSRWCSPAGACDMCLRSSSCQSVQLRQTCVNPLIDVYVFYNASLPYTVAWVPTRRHLWKQGFGQMVRGSLPIAASKAVRRVSLACLVTSDHSDRVCFA